MPDWADGNQRARNAADEVKTPTLANMANTLERLADAGHVIDIYIFAHGLEDEFTSTDGNYENTVDFTATDITRLARAGTSYTGYSQLPIRMVYQTNCYGATLLDDWVAIGGKAAMGPPLVNFFPNQFNKFAREWIDGMSFADAVEEMNTASSRTVMHALMLLDARDSANDGLEANGRTWSGCPPLKTVLSRHSCAKDYFVVTWAETPDEWVDGENGKEFMRRSSDHQIDGDGTLTITSTPSW